MHNTQCTVHNAQYTMHSAHCTVHNAQYTMHSAQCTVHNAQYTAQYVMHKLRAIGTKVCPLFPHKFNNRVLGRSGAQGPKTSQKPGY